MASLSEDIQRVLDLAADFTPSVSPRMRERAAVLADLAVGIHRALDGPAGRSWNRPLGLQVRAGGQQGSVALVPWVRVYAPDQSPTAQQGIYLTYLFAADGSRAYNSLMHGSSEFRSGSMRAITDQRVLLARAAVARSALGDLAEAGAAAGASLSIDLAWQGRRSPDRARAYESANILAREYTAGQIPSDTQLLEDLSGMLPLLARLYGAGLAWQDPISGADTRAAPSARQQAGLAIPTSAGPSSASPRTTQLPISRSTSGRSSPSGSSSSAMTWNAPDRVARSCTWKSKAPAPSARKSR
jgi:hypothetical protein